MKFQMLALLIASDFEPRPGEIVKINEDGLGSRMGSAVDYEYITPKRSDDRGQNYAIIRPTPDANREFMPEDYRD